MRRLDITWYPCNVSMVTIVESQGDAERSIRNMATVEQSIAARESVTTWSIHADEQVARTEQAQRIRRRALIANVSRVAASPDALTDALQSRIDALTLTVGSDARDGVYGDAEALADAYLSTDTPWNAESAARAFREPASAPVHTCMTRAEWAQCWDDAVEAGSWITRQWYARQERAALVSESLHNATIALMGASSTFVLDISDGLRISDIANVERNHKVKTAGQRHRAQYISESEPDVMYGRWREYDRTSSPLVRTRVDVPRTLRERSDANPFAWHTGRELECILAGVDGRASERAALKAAQREMRLAQMRAAKAAQTARNRNAGHTISADLTAMLERARAGTSER